MTKGVEPFIRRLEYIRSASFAVGVVPYGYIAQEERLATSPNRWQDLISRSRRCYPRSGNGGLSWRLSSGLSLSVGLSIQEAAI